MKQWSRWFAAGLLAAVLSVNAAAVAAEPAEDKRPVRAVRCASAVGGCAHLFVMGLRGRDDLRARRWSLVGLG